VYFYIACFYCILSLVFIFYMYVCLILPIQLLGCHIEINGSLIIVLVWYNELEDINRVM